ncbi:MAG: ATP-binding protein [Desulfomicrobium apsheronum]|nr:ATP-binding protein [Desulfomicrobium apsheronum]
MLVQRLQQHRNRLTRTIIFASVIPVILATTGAFIMALVGIDLECRRVASEEILLHAQTYARSIHFRLESAVSALDAFAMVQDLKNQDALASFFTRMKTTHEWLDGVTVMDEQGKTLASFGSPGQVPASVWPAFFQNTGHRPAPIITDVQKASDGTPRFFMIAKAGGIESRQIICLSANAHAFSSLLDRVRLGRTGEVFLVNQDGTLQTRSIMHRGILDTTDGQLAQNREQSPGTHIREWNGSRMWFAVTHIESNPSWRLVAQREEGEILQTRKKWMERFAALGTVCLISLAGVAFFAAGRIRRIQAEMEEEQASLADHCLQAQKLDAISQLGVGIAHEVNNPLAIIGEEAGWMQDVLKNDALKDAPGTNDLRESLRQIAMQIGRCREITHKLLSFGGKADGIITDVDINIIIKDIIALRRREYSQRNIEIVDLPAQDLPVVHTESTLLRHLLLNLINNSMDAMSEGGRITIATGKSEDGGVIITVQDEGFGIPEENLARIFEPFFTTKPPGKGAGLGLSICHGIMQRIGGEIFVKSEPGKGTTVTIELPLAPHCKDS